MNVSSAWLLVLTLNSWVYWIMAIMCLVPLKPLAKMPNPSGLLGWLPLASTINSQPLWFWDFLSVLFDPDWLAVSCTVTTSGRTWRCCGFPGGGKCCVLWDMYTRLKHSHCLSIPVQLAVSAHAAVPLFLSVCHYICLHVSASGLCRLSRSLNLRY